MLGKHTRAREGPVRDAGSLPLWHGTGSWLIPPAPPGPSRRPKSNLHIWKSDPLKQTRLHNNGHLEPVTTTFLVKIVF